MGNNYIVYMHENKINHKKYIGLTKHSIEKRYNSGYGYRNSTKFQNAIKKYGWNNFEHFIMCSNLTLDEANKLEMFFIKKFNSIEEGYNITSGGEGTKSHKVSESTRKKLSEMFKGRKQTKETIDKRKNTMKNRIYCYKPNKTSYKKGHIVSDEIREKLSKANKGKHSSLKTEFPKRECFVYDKDMNFVKKYESLADVHRELGINNASRHIDRINKDGTPSICKGYILKSQVTDNPFFRKIN